MGHVPEVLPLSVRGTAMGVAVCLHWFGELPGVADLPDHARQLGPGPVFLGYAGMGVIAFLFVKALVTETKGRSLEEIEADLQRKRAPASPGGGRRRLRPLREGRLSRRADAGRHAYAYDSLAKRHCRTGLLAGK